MPGETFPPAQPDREPTEDEERAAERAAEQVDLDAVSAHEEEMLQRGANVQGEGAIEPGPG